MNRTVRLVVAGLLAVAAACSGGDGPGEEERSAPSASAAPSTTVDTTPPSPEAHPNPAGVTSCPTGLVISVDRGYATDPTRPCAPDPVRWWSSGLEGDGVVLTEPLRFQTLDSRNVFSPVVFELASVRIGEDCNGTALRTGPEGPEVVHLQARADEGRVRIRMWLDPPGATDRRPVGRLDLEVVEPGFLSQRCDRS